jgi:hypothetical protein
MSLLEMTLTERIKREIDISEMTVHAIARSANISPAKIYSFVAGKTGLALRNVERLLPTLGLEVRRKR